MKKEFLKGFVLGAMIFGTVTSLANVAYNAVTASFPILVNGQVWESEKPAVVIEGSTYLPLKALGEVLNVNVTWNSTLNRVEIGSETLTTENKEILYIGNKNSMKLHLSTCSSVEDIMNSNKVAFSSKEEANEYTPCKICNP